MESSFIRHPTYLAFSLSSFLRVERLFEKLCSRKSNSKNSTNNIFSAPGKELRNFIATSPKWVATLKRWFNVNKDSKGCNSGDTERFSAGYACRVSRVPRWPFSWYTNTFAGTRPLPGRVLFYGACNARRRNPRFPLCLKSVNLAFRFLMFARELLFTRSVVRFTCQSTLDFCDSFNPFND